MEGGKAHTQKKAVRFPPPASEAVTFPGKPLSGGKAQRGGAEWGASSRSCRQESGGAFTLQSRGAFTLQHFPAIGLEMTKHQARSVSLGHVLGTRHPFLPTAVQEIGGRGNVRR